MNFEDIAADYRSSFPTCDWDDFHEPVHACRNADYEICGASSTVLIEVELQCGGNMVVGIEDGSMWAEVAVDFVKDGGYALYMKESEDIEESSIFFRPCDDSCGTEASRRYKPTEEWDWEVPLPYEAGRYVVRFMRPADQPGTMSLEMRGYDCDTP